MKKKKKVKKKLFRFPKKIYLLDGEYKIILKEDKDMFYTNKDGNEYGRNLGTLRPEKKTITFNKWLRTSREETFWHELGHHFLMYYNLPNSEALAEAFAKFVTNINKQIKNEQKNTR
jgi:hypothetical protein